MGFFHGFVEGISIMTVVILYNSTKQRWDGLEAGETDASPFIFFKKEGAARYSMPVKKKCTAFNF